MSLHPKRILNRHQIHPKISLGQNFLVDEPILQRICDLGSLTKSDSVLEIGPGIGSLTRMLSDLAGLVTAVELDQRLIPVLEEELEGYDNVRLVQGDILECRLSEIIDSPFKVVANVPYYITGAIFKMLLTEPDKPDLMVLTVQSEVADRLTAKPGNMSILAVSVQLHGEIEKKFTIRSGSFWPKPNVDSAVVQFRAYSESLIEHSELVDFMRLVKTGFSSKRKQLQKNLRAIILDRQRIGDLLDAAGIDGTRRAQSLSIEEWLVLFKLLG